MKLYKYRDFSDPSEDDFQRLEELLHQGAFWCARPDTLNDPEEFSWSCEYTASTVTQELLTELLIRVTGGGRQLAREHAATAVSSGRLAALAKPIVEDMIQRCRNEFGLVCFGTSSDNPVLWRRYGGGGAGVCVEIDVPNALLGKEIHRVHYSFAKSIHIDQVMRAFLNTDRMQEVYMLALLSKPMRWAPEDELRFVSRKQEVLVRINGSRISRLILGERLNEAVRRRVGEIAAAHQPGLIL